MKYIKKFEDYLGESETSSYKPPKYLVSPALAQDGSGKVDDPLTQYMEEELAKSKSYFKPGIRSANPPKNGDEVDRRLEDEMDESVNEGMSKAAAKKQIKIIDKMIDDETGGDGEPLTDETLQDLERERERLVKLSESVNEGEEVYNVIDKETEKLITDAPIRKSLALRLAAKKKRWIIQKHKESVNEGKEISKGKIDMMGSKILNRIKIGAKFVTDGGDYTVTGFGPKSNAFQEYEAEKDGKPCKVKLTAMYGVKLEVTDDPRSAVYRKEEMLNSIILESVMNEENTNMKMVKTFSEYSTINENRFKQGKEIFGYKIEKNRPKLKPEVIATLADVVKEFTEAYKSIEDRDRNIFDLTDALQKEIERFDKKYWRSIGWDEETIASRLVDAFRTSIKAQKPSMTAIKAMLSELPLDSGWG